MIVKQFINIRARNSGVCRQYADVELDLDIYADRRHVCIPGNVGPCLGKYKIFITSDLHPIKGIPELVY